MREISKESLGTAIYDRIARDLVSGRLRPNQKITIRGLADSLGTSSTPVRDAVQRLLQDQALEQRSLRDVRVPVPAMDQYHEILRIRIELEGLAAGQAATLADDKALARLNRIIDRNARAMARGNWTAAAACNQQFHFALAEIARMPLLLDILGRLWLRMGPLIAGYYAHVHGDQAHGDMVSQHRRIVAACAAGDSAAARRAMQTDIEEPQGGIAEYIRSFAAGQDVAGTHGRVVF